MISGETVMGVTTNVNEFSKMKLTEKWVWQWVEDTGKEMKRGEKYELQIVCKKKWERERKTREKNSTWQSFAQYLANFTGRQQQVDKWKKIVNCWKKCVKEIMTVRLVRQCSVPGLLAALETTALAWKEK